MKKLTKLVSAIAFASALALVGCANPAGGDKTVSKVSVSEVKKPTDYKAASNPVKDAKVGNQLVGAITENVMQAFGTAMNNVMDSEEFMTDNKASSDNYDQKEIENDKAFDKAIASKTKVTLENEWSIKPKTYKLAEDNGSFRFERFTESNKISIDGATNASSFSHVNDGTYSCDVKNTSLILPGFNNFAKAFKINTRMYMSENGESDGTTDTFKGSESFDISYVAMFDVNGVNGFIRVSGKNISNYVGKDKPTVEYKDISVTFYDINQKETYSYNDKDIEALKTLM